jgi:hypothetical protein
MKQQSESDMLNLKNRARAASIQNGPASAKNTAERMEDGETSQTDGAQILMRIRDEAFDSSDEKLAIALGRTSDEIAEWLSGEGKIDSDALMKARALASERAVELD